ncbi:hypothetical protein Tco_0516747 [Tanacetum coccineum]
MVMRPRLISILWMKGSISFFYKYKSTITVRIGPVFGRVFLPRGMKEMDRYRCTLRPETVEALYCAKDWLRSEIFVNMDSVVKMEFPI